MKIPVVLRLVPHVTLGHRSGVARELRGCFSGVSHLFLTCKWLVISVSDGFGRFSGTIKLSRFDLNAKRRRREGAREANREVGGPVRMLKIMYAAHACCVFCGEIVFRFWREAVFSQTD